MRPKLTIPALLLALTLAAAPGAPAAGTASPGAGGTAAPGSSPAAGNTATAGLTVTKKSGSRHILTNTPTGAGSTAVTGSRAATPGTGAPATTAGPSSIITTPAAATGQPAGTIAGRRPAAHSPAAGGGLSSGALLAAILGGLALLICLGWALLRSRAVEPHWLLSLRHSLAEGGYRASATWAEFADWIRLGH
jgi:hypothetical protein